MPLYYKASVRLIPLQCALLQLIKLAFPTALYSSERWVQGRVIYLLAIVHR